MDLSLAYPAVFLVLATGAAGALAWWSYGRSTPRVTGVRRATLAGLRFFSLAAVVLLLFEPVFQQTEKQSEAPVLAVLIDDSESLTARPPDGADEPSPAQAIQDALSRLDASTDVRVYRFAETAGRLRSPDSLRFNGERTDIAQALEHIAGDLDGRNLQGIALLSDGRYTAGRNPLYLAERSSVPIFTAVVGDTSAQRDVRVSRVVTNEIAYAGSTLPVRVSVHAAGFGGESARVALIENGRTLASQSLRLPEDGLEATVELAIASAEPGFHRYTVSVSRQPEEATYRNNTETFTVRVLDSRRRVLLLAAAPSPDLAALRTVLEDHAFTVLTTRVQRAPGVFYEGPLPNDLSPYDVVVLVGYPGRAADVAAQEAVATAIAEGLPALFVLTTQTNLSALQQPLGSWLPAAPEVMRRSFSEVTAEVTPAGATHPILQMPGVDPDALSRLPPLFYNESRWVAASEARVLATTRRGGVSINSPLLVVRARGPHRTAALLGAGTWRWASLPQDLSDLDSAYPALIENLITWLAARTDRRLVQVEADRPLFSEREQVTFSGQVYDESLETVDDADIQITVAAPDGTETPFLMQPLGNGRYSLEAQAFLEGEYTFTANASKDGQAFGTDRGAFSVGPLSLEFREPGADAGLMRGIAQRSGGYPIALSEVLDLPARLKSEGRFGPRVVEHEHEKPLLHLPLLLALIVIALTTEWFLRKRAGMV